MFKLNDKIYININIFSIKQAEKVNIFILLLIVMGTLVPEITNAKSKPEIEILTIDKKIDSADEYSKKLCSNWNLSKENIRDFFLTAESFITGAEMSYFNIYPCEIDGRLLVNDLERKYSINLGGSAFIYGFKSEQQGYGCRRGECLKYVHYEKVEWD